MENDKNMSESWWNMLGVLFRWRRFIVGVTVFMAVTSVVISLMLPNWYKASSRLLLPESGAGGLAGALLGNLGSAAKSLLGGSGGDYVRYMAILDSRAVKLEVIEAFDLVTVYELTDEDYPLEEALKSLADNVEFVVDDEFDFMSIEVWDKDPERAADMSNFFVQRLDDVSNRLNKQTAGNFRAYVEQRYNKAAADRQVLLDSLESFQATYGVFNVEAQTEAFFTQLAEMRAAAIQVELQYEALRVQYGDENQQVRQLKALADAAETKFQQALSGREAVLPVGIDRAPAMVRSYADIAMERLIQETILEMVAPILEQARFEEEQQKQSLQIVDEAVPPVKKGKPKRSVIVVVATLSAFLLAVLYALLWDWWQRRHAEFTRRLQHESRKHASK